MDALNKPPSSWSFEEGVLTVYHLGQKIDLGRYKTHEHARKAAELYFTQHGGKQ